MEKPQPGTYGTSADPYQQPASYQQPAAPYQQPAYGNPPTYATEPTYQPPIYQVPVPTGSTAVEPSPVLAFDSSFIKTPRGLLKILQFVFHLITFIALNLWIYARMGYVVLVVISSWTTDWIILGFYLSGMIGFLPAQQARRMELITLAIYALNLFICMIVSAATPFYATGGSVTCAVFTIFNAIAHGADAFLLYRSGGSQF